MKILRDGKWIEIPGKDRAALRAAAALRGLPDALVKAALAAFKPPAGLKLLDVNYALALINA